MNDLLHPCEVWAEPISLAAAGCLSPDEEAEARRHIETCPACRERFRQLAEVCGALAELRLPVGDEELAVVRRAASAVSSGEARRSAVEWIRRVLGRRPRESHGPVFRTQRPFDWRWIMRHPASFASAAVFLFVIGGVALWFHGGGTTPALADFITPILEAKTVKFKFVGEIDGRITMRGVVMVLAPSRGRVEQEEISTKSKSVEITSSFGGKSILLVPDKKLAVVNQPINAPRDEAAKNFLGVLRSYLLDARDKADVRREPLGEKEIDGRRAVGFRLSGRGLHDPGWVMSLWGDPQTGEPIRIEKTDLMCPGKKVTMSDFVFNLDLDESLFSLEVPTGYKIVNIQSDLSLPNEKSLIETFRQYGRLSGGIFPDTLNWHLILLQIVNQGPKKQAVRPKSEERQNVNRREMKRGGDALETLREKFVGELGYRGIGFAVDLPPEADAHYAGKGVKLGAADTPIFWYRPKDAKKYRVIYADLSVRESATPPHVPNAQPVPAPASPKI